MSDGSNIVQNRGLRQPGETDGQPQEIPRVHRPCCRLAERRVDPGRKAQGQAQAQARGRRRQRRPRAHPNAPRSSSLVEPQSVDAVRGAMKLARTEKRALCIAGGRHAMGTQQFATDGVLLDIRKMNKVLAFDTEHGLIEMESGMQWPQLLEHLAAARFSGEKQWAFSQKQTCADRLTM